MFWGPTGTQQKQKQINLCESSSAHVLSVGSGGGVQAPDAGDDDDSDDDDSTVRSRVDGSPSVKRNELQTYESTNSSLAGGLTIPSAAPKSNDDPGNLSGCSSNCSRVSFLVQHQHGWDCIDSLTVVFTWFQRMV